MHDRALVPEICGAQSCIVVHTNQLFFRGLKRLPDPGQELVVICHNLVTVRAKSNVTQRYRMLSNYFMLFS
jgi:hypothetical protein